MARIIGFELFKCSIEIPHAEVAQKTAKSICVIQSKNGCLFHVLSASCVAELGLTV